MPRVIYLTGAPASGKSYTTRILRDRVPDLLNCNYGARQIKHVRCRSDWVVTHEDLRARSAGVVTPQDMDEVEHALIAFVTGYRTRRHFLIDSHPVTKKAYGYRITPFWLDRFAQLAADEIWVLIPRPEEARRRIAAGGGGRPMATEEEARTHTAPRASVAATYSMSLGQPVYRFDTGAPRKELIAPLAERMA